MIEVVPAIIPESFDDLREHIAQVRKYVSRVQVDIVDGRYAPSTTWPYRSDEHFDELVKQSERLPFWEEVDVELDVMVEKPENIVDEWMQVGIAAFILHVESTKKHKEIVEKLRENGVEVVFALKPSTPNEEFFTRIEEVGGVDAVQCMGNDRVGYHGVELDEEKVLPKVKEIREKYPKMPLAVDIGVNRDTAARLVSAGVTRLVAGSAIFGSGDIKEAINYFESLLV